MARILLIDDEADLRSFLRLALQCHGHDVTEAATGRVLLDSCEPSDSSARFDLIITDLIMPDGEGIETIRAARSKMPDARIIAMSGAVHAAGSAGGYLGPARHIGADATLYKPFSTADLFRMVDATLQAA